MLMLQASKCLSCVKLFQNVEGIVSLENKKKTNMDGNPIFSYISVPQKSNFTCLSEQTFIKFKQT